VAEAQQTHGELIIQPVADKAGRAAFVDYAYRRNASDRNWVANLRSEEISKFTPDKNPYFAHARVQLFLAKRGGKVVGRIAAHIDELALAQPVEQGMGPGTGNWGAIEADDEGVARTLIATAEEWLRKQGMTRVLAPMNLSVWEEPGLQVLGHDHPPMVMMAHHDPAYRAWIEGAGYQVVKRLYTYEIDVRKTYPPLIQRIIASGEKNAKINVREVVLKDFDKEAAIICDILNDAWSENWGFVPFTQEEIAHIGKQLKPLVHPDLIRIAEYEGEPVAFMITLPDFNVPQLRINGRTGKPSLLGWIKLALWLRKPRPAEMRVPLMGVRKRLQSSRLASQLAFMMIEYIRRAAVGAYGAKRGEIGWVLDDNQGMVAIADAIQSRINREYHIYEKAL
jgi:GNAT superfamily N-acetyltransferase